MSIGTKMRYKPLKRKNGLRAKRPRKTPQKGKNSPHRANLPPYLPAIPLGTHGSGILQKKLWKLVSDMVRIRDFHQWGGRCVATGKKLSSYQEGQAGHFKSYSKCNGLYKFNPDNIFLQSAYSNSFGDKDDWKAFEEEIIRRHGKKHLEKIEEENKNTPLPIRIPDILAAIENMIELIQTLPEQPPYWPRLTKLRTPTPSKNI